MTEPVHMISATLDELKLIDMALIRAIEASHLRSYIRQQWETLRVEIKYKIANLENYERQALNER